MAAVVDRELVRDVAKVFVSRTAPAELAMFDVIFEAQVANRRWLRWPWGKDETLGFGIEAATTVTPIVISIVTTVLSDLSADAVKAAGRRGVVGARAMLRRIFGADNDESGTPEPETSMLSEDRWQQIRDQVYQAAIAHHLSEQEARRLAEAVGTPEDLQPGTESGAGS